MPEALVNVPRLVRVLNTTVSAVDRAKPFERFDVDTVLRDSKTQRGVLLHGSSDEQRLRRRREIGPLRKDVVHGGLAHPIEDHPEAAAVVVFDDVDDRARECGLGQVGRCEEQRTRPHAVGRLHVAGTRHTATLGSVGVLG